MSSPSPSENGASESASAESVPDSDSGPAGSVTAVTAAAAAAAATSTPLKNNSESTTATTTSNEEVDQLASGISSIQVDGGAGSVSLASIADQIRRGAIQRILVLTGAGISVSAGIPDFRSPKTGLYHNLSRFALPHPTAVFELDFFRRQPTPFFMLAKELYPTGQFRPTPTHWFIRLLEERGLLLRNLTQNIDGLEYLAGVSPNMLIQAHGGFSRAACIDCKKSYVESFVKDAIFADQIPRCLNCDGLVKPCITFFGESLPTEFHQAVPRDFPRADLLIVMGTSLKVQPFASLIERVGKGIPRILINNEAAGEADESETSQQIEQLESQLVDLDKSHPMYFKLSQLLAHLKRQQQSADSSFGFNFRKVGTRDVFYRIDCDTGVRKFAEMIGPEYAERLEEMIRNDRNNHSASPTPQGTNNHNESSSSSPPSSSSALVSPIAIGFDFDHTLGLDHGLELNGLQAYIDHSFPALLTGGRFDATQKKTGESCLKRFRDGHIDMLTMLRDVARTFDLSSDAIDELSIAGYQSECMKLVDQTTPLAGARELLRWLKERGVPTAILTNGWSPLQQGKVRAALGEDAPPHVLVSDQLPAAGSKPSKLAFDALASLPGFKGRAPSSMIYVGDNPAVDIGGALSYGMQAVWMDWENQTYPDGQPPPTLTIHHLDTLLKSEFIEKQINQDQAKL